VLRPVFPKPLEYQAFLTGPDQSPQHGRNTAVRFPFSERKRAGGNRLPHLSHRPGPERACKIWPLRGWPIAGPAWALQNWAVVASPDAAVQSARAFAVNGEV